MNRSAFRLFALLLPLAGFAALWGWTHYRAQQGTDWDVPVQGYDPRDLLRGHYIVFQYDWPGLDRLDNTMSGWDELCLEGRAPVIDRVSLPRSEGCANHIRADDVSTYGTAGLVRGRLYVPQDKAFALEEKLRDPALQGVVRIRLRNDGHITPMSISFRPRPPEAAPDSPPRQ